MSAFVNAELCRHFAPAFVADGRFKTAVALHRLVQLMQIQVNSYAHTTMSQFKHTAC
jgi:hypothetical protein